MSLSKDIISKENGFSPESIRREIEYPWNNLFGFEIWRQTLWGHKIIKDLGCDLVHSLRDTDVIKLKNEFQKILNHIDLVSEETNIEKSSIEFRIKNGLEVIRIVEKYIDKIGVNIG